MRSKTFYQGVYAATAVYDLALGAVFFLFYKTIFSIFNIQLPDVPPVYHLLAAFVFVQGIGYYFAYRDLKRNVDMIRVGVVYKGAYAALAFYYWATGALPHLIFGLFALCDLTSAVLFVLFLRDYNRLLMELE